MSVSLEQITQNGRLRAAFNLGNRALVRETSDGELLGVSPVLARRLADRLGAELVEVIYPGAGKVVEAALEDRWDVGFLAIDPRRRERVSFTRPYYRIEATYAVPKASRFGATRELDKPGFRILTSAGSAYALYLRKALRHAELVERGTPDECFASFRNSPFDAVAGVRASLEAQFSDDPEIRILPDALTQVDQAMVLPGPDNPAISALDAFVAEILGEADKSPGSQLQP